MKKIIIDTSTPWIPDGFTLEENRSLGKIEWKPKNINLFVSEKQKMDWQKGEELNKELKNPLTSAVLKYLLDNPTLIPDEWKGKYIYFHGTILQHSNGNRCVLYLYWSGGRWHWFARWLDFGWYAGNPSAVLAISSQISDTQTFLDPLDLDLENAIKICKQAGLSVTKVY